MQSEKVPLRHSIVEILKKNLSQSTSLYKSIWCSQGLILTLNRVVTIHLWFSIGLWAIPSFWTSAILFDLICANLLSELLELLMSPLSYSYVIFILTNCNVYHTESSLNSDLPFSELPLKYREITFRKWFSAMWKKCFQTFAKWYDIHGGTTEGNIIHEAVLF